MENVSDPTPINRWTIPFADFIKSYETALKEHDEEQVQHLLNDFWVCEKYMLLKSDIVGEVQ